MSLKNGSAKQGAIQAESHKSFASAASLSFSAFTTSLAAPTYFYDLIVFLADFSQETETFNTMRWQTIAIHQFSSVALLPLTTTLYICEAKFDEKSSNFPNKLSYSITYKVSFLL
jgi:hypothetical protein